MTNYRLAKTVPISPRVFEALEFLNEPRSTDAVAKRFKLKDAQSKDLLSGLVVCGLAEWVTDESKVAADASWSSWDPAAGYFHFTTRDTLFNDDLVAGEQLLREKAVRNPPPPATKPADGRSRTTLGPPAASSLTRLLRKRRTWRTFSPLAVSISSVSTLLKYTFGAQHWAASPVHGRLALKTSPSGGACHPIEAYVAAVNVTGLRAGLYHYDCEHHQLIEIKRGLARKDLGRLIQAQPWFWAAPLVVFMTAVFGRTAWRYPTPRAYRNVLLEAGHLCQTFCLLATDLRLAPFCTHALHDSRVDEALGLDGVSEGVLYAAGCGVQPKTGWSAEIPGVTKGLS